MAKAKAVKIASGLLWKTCLVLWQNNYLESKAGQHTAHRRLCLGIGVVIGVGQDSLVLALCMSRMRDFGNSSFSGMNQTRGGELSKIIIPRKKTGRLSKKRPSASHVDACYEEKGNIAIFPEVIHGVSWLSEQDKKSIVATLPKFHNICKEFTKRERLK